jgi:prepilin-type N-terminal cleavage/methylation domain-containing protein
MERRMLAVGRARKGFTLLELMIIVVIIGILASLAIAKFGTSKRLAYVSAMKMDLRNLATSAESKFATDNSYAGLLAPTGSAGVSITVTSTSSTWSATAIHANVPNITCMISSESPPGPDQRPMPDCR